MNDEVRQGPLARARYLYARKEGNFINKWRIYVAGITLEIESGGDDFETLRRTGLFGEIEQVGYFQTYERDNLWIYRVELNNRMETAVIKRVEGEAGK